MRHNSKDSVPTFVQRDENLCAKQLGMALPSGAYEKRFFTLHRDQSKWAFAAPNADPGLDSFAQPATHTLQGWVGTGVGVAVGGIKIVAVGNGVDVAVGDGDGVTVAVEVGVAVLVGVAVAANTEKPSGLLEATEPVWAVTELIVEVIEKTRANRRIL
jgi:hypothetical protein